MKNRLNLMLIRLIPIAVAILGCGPNRPGGIDAGPTQIVPAGLGTPTDLVAVQKNDINGVQLTWVSHSTVKFDSLVVFRIIHQDGGVMDGELRGKNGEVHTIYDVIDGEVGNANVNEVATVAFAVKDCLPPNFSKCSEPSEVVDVNSQPMHLVAPTNVTVSNDPPAPGENTRSIRVAWQDNSYGEMGYEIRVCDRADPGYPISLIQRRGPDITVEQIGLLPPNTKLWIYVKQSFGNNYSNTPWQYTSWAGPALITTSP